MFRLFLCVMTMTRRIGKETGFFLSTLRVRGRKSSRETGQNRRVVQLLTLIEGKGIIKKIGDNDARGRER